MLSASLGPDAALRTLEPWQAEEFAAHVARIRGHLLPWVPFAGVVSDVDSARAYLQRHADRQARDTGRIYGIWSAGELVGGTLFVVFDTGQRVCEIGVWLAPEAQGRGLIGTAVRAMVDWAVRVRGMRRVEWRTDPRNERSIAVARRLGMRLDGVLRSAFELNGVRTDTQVWSLLAEEWPAQPPDARGGSTRRPS